MTGWKVAVEGLMVGCWAVVGCCWGSFLTPTYALMSRQTAKVVVPETVQVPAAVPQFQYAKTQEQVEKLK
jgi:hypothetical protein